jgi:hypothetical protein
VQHEAPYHLPDGGAIEERFRHVVDAVQDHDFRVSASLHRFWHRPVRTAVD